MSQDDKPRRGRRIMSGDERALSGFRDRDTAPLGVPITVDNDRTPFPVELSDALKEDPKLLFVAKLIWSHATNVELRSAEVIRHTDAGELAELVDKIQHRLDETIGVNGDNGKLSKLDARVRSLEGNKKWLIGAIGSAVMLAASGVGVAVKGLYAAGERDGQRDTRIEQNRHDLDRLSDELQQIWTFTFRSKP